MRSLRWAHFLFLGRRFVVRKKIRMSEKIKGYAVVGAFTLMLMAIIEGVRLCSAGRLGDALMLLCLETPILSVGFYLFFTGLGEIVEKVCGTAKEPSNDKERT